MGRLREALPQRSLEQDTAAPRMTRGVYFDHHLDFSLISVCRAGEVTGAGIAQAAQARSARRGRRRHGRTSFAHSSPLYRRAGRPTFRASVAILPKRRRLGERLELSCGTDGVACGRRQLSRNLRVQPLRFARGGGGGRAFRNLGGACSRARAWLRRWRRELVTRRVRRRRIPGLGLHPREIHALCNGRSARLGAGKQRKQAHMEDDGGGRCNGSALRYAPGLNSHQPIGARLHFRFVAQAFRLGRELEKNGIAWGERPMGCL